MTELKVLRKGSQGAIILGKKLTVSEMPDLKNELKHLIGEGVTALTLDCSQLTMMDSTGIGCLVAAYNSLDQVDGKLFMVQVSPDMYDLLCSMRLDRRVKITRFVAN
jgi:anti-anti-sigma factor